MDGYPLKNHVSISNPLSIGYPMDIRVFEAIPLAAGVA
jgi:hypothetical protein